MKENQRKTKRLHVTLLYRCVRDSGIDVDENLSLNEAIEYAKEHIREIELPMNYEYVMDSEEIDEENCDFED